MFQKIQKAFEKFVKEKGQGTVEYALILGFVAVIAVFIFGSSGLKDSIQKNIQNINSVATLMDAEYSKAASDITIGGSESHSEKPGIDNWD